MNRVILSELYAGKTVYYIPSHLDKTIDNAERGTISTVSERGVWVRYTTGDTAAKTDIHDLYK